MTLFETAQRCWEGRIGEHETLPRVEQLTQGFSERELRHSIAMLLNDISSYGRLALAGHAKP